MATIPTPTQKIVPISGDALVVQMREIPGAPNEVFWTVTRNGGVAHQFSITELQSILTATNQLLTGFRGRIPSGAKS